MSPTTAGFAFPCESFITCPLRKLIDAGLPPLYSATAFGFASIACLQSP
jgi:hypothetical protein